MHVFSFVFKFLAFITSVIKSDHDSKQLSLKSFPDPDNSDFLEVNLMNQGQVQLSQLCCSRLPFPFIRAAGPRSGRGGRP